MKSLQSLRFVFALMIFFHHVPCVNGAYFNAGGTLSVSFFFVLSGFVLAMAYGEKVMSDSFDSSSFIVKRLCKIYPMHLLCLFLYLLLNYSSFSPRDLFRLIPNAVLMQSWIPDRGFYFSGNALSWFLSDMMFFYVMFPFVYEAVARMFHVGNHRINDCGMKCVAVSVCRVGGNVLKISNVQFFVVLYIVIVVFLKKDQTHPLLYINPFFRLYDFVIGIVLYFIYKYVSNKYGNRIKDLSSTCKSLIEIVIIMLLVLQVLLFQYVPDRIGYACYWWVIVSVIILAASLFDRLGGGIVTRILKTKALTYMGDCSFCIYMIHVLVLQVVEKNIDSGWVMSLIVTFISTVVIAIILYEWFEKPVSSYIMKKYEAKRF